MNGQGEQELDDFVNYDLPLGSKKFWVKRGQMNGQVEQELDDLVN